MVARYSDSTQSDAPGYTGHVEDDELGLVYMQQRYYDANIGRFYSNDPVGFKASNPMLFNRYAYANNNPYKYVDPDGEDALSVQGELNFPPVVSVVAEAMDITIPSGINISATFSFPGFSEDGKWGAGISTNAVFGAEPGVAENPKSNSLLKSIGKTLMSPGITIEADYSFEKNGVFDVQNGLGDTQFSANVLVGGGQVSVDDTGGISGFGIKVGPGLNAGAIKELPLVGLGIEEDRGFIMTGGNNR
ncbi:RHS repeat-associated core domain-containing protein [Pseudidiomarina salilacus]|uniref:RHS repeat-associated core domain-containing protein n=1 Tax=Pseudidiomarina salilacus TaxID=3384452 RepID=UPI0039855FE9